VPRPRDGGEWAGYFAAQSGRRPRTLLRQALDRFGAADDGARLAIDLGSGAGADTLELLRRGWRVLAIDREPAAIEHLVQHTPDRYRRRLRARVVDFTTADLPPAELIHCGWSLPHCPAEDFPPVWSRLRSALRADGRVVGQLLGNRDDWAAGPLSTAVDTRQLLDLLAGLVIEACKEVEFDGDSFDGPKHWHFFEVIARQPGCRWVAGCQG
jgi:SAM-dependent methyltransferase